MLYARPVHFFSIFLFTAGRRREQGGCSVTHLSFVDGKSVVSYVLCEIVLADISIGEKN